MTCWKTCDDLLNAKSAILYTLRGARLLTKSVKLIMNLRDLFDQNKLDITHIRIERLHSTISSIDLGTTFDVMETDDRLKFYLHGNKLNHTLLLPKFYASLVMYDNGEEEDDLGKEFRDKGKYSFMIKLIIPKKDEKSREPLMEYVHYYCWFVIDNIQNISMQLFIPNIWTGEIVTLNHFSNPKKDVTYMIENLANILILNAQEKGFIPYPYAKFCDPLLYMFGYLEKEDSYFLHQYDDKKEYEIAKTEMTKKLHDFFV